MPRIEHAGPLDEALRAMPTGTPTIQVYGARFDDHVRVYFARADGSGTVADFGISLDGRNLFMEHKCPTAGTLPAPVPEGEVTPGLIERVRAYVAKQYDGLGTAERLVWLGRYRNLHLVEYFPQGEGSVDFRPVRMTAILVAADEGHTRDLGDVCHFPPRDLLLDGHHQVLGDPLALETEGLGAWSDPAVRQPILEAALAAARAEK